MWFVSRVHYCVQMLPGVMFFQAFPLPFPLLKFVSFMVFLWYYYWISMEFLWGFHDVSMIFLEDFYGFLKGCYGSSMVFLWDFHWIPMGFLWYFYDVFMIFLWGFYWVPMEFLLDSCGISKVCP